MKFAESEEEMNQVSHVMIFLTCHKHTVHNSSKIVQSEVRMTFPHDWHFRMTSVWVLPVHYEIKMQLIVSFPLLRCFVRLWHFQEGQRVYENQILHAFLWPFWRGHEDHVHFHQTTASDCIPVQLVNTFALLRCFVRSWHFQKGQRNTWTKYYTHPYSLSEEVTRIMYTSSTSQHQIPCQYSYLAIFHSSGVVLEYENHAHSYHISIEVHLLIWTVVKSWHFSKTSRTIWKHVPHFA